MDDTAHRRAEWQGRYEKRETGWDRGQVSPALDHWFGNGNSRPRRVLVPGCGRGYEVVALAARGFDVTAIDIAPAAVAALQGMLEREGVSAQVVETDLLHWQAPAPFDAVYEQTCLCALHPSTWLTYVARLRAWLRRGGELFAQFMQTGREGGPPFHCEVRQMRDLFDGEAWEWADAPPVRVDHPNGLHELGYRLTYRG